MAASLSGRFAPRVHDLGEPWNFPLGPGLVVTRRPQGGLTLWVVGPGRLVRRFVLAGPVAPAPQEGQ